MIGDAGDTPESVGDTADTADSRNVTYKPP